MWFTILIIVIVIGAIIGAVCSDDGEKGAGAISGAVTAGIGCGAVMFRILLFVFGIFLIFKLFAFLFG